MALPLGDHVEVEHGGESSEKGFTGRHPEGGHAAATAAAVTSPTETVRRKIYYRRPGSPRRAASVSRSSSFTSASSASSSLSSPSFPSEPTPSSRLPHPLASSSGDGRAGHSGGSTSSRERARTGAEIQRGLVGKWLMGGDAAPVALDPVVVDAKMDGEGQTGRTVVGGVGRCSGMVSVKARTGKEEKEKGKERGRGWGWTGWW
ncbi:hypothetical protein MYCTH_2124220 [Thermothelomyces thermophilus ATCC 42464]|uniref:Uncharacterized protein n=1 Tax=Thermothelomyces thermophilus (strain ATCC 42464 / BCRC 31852 / DSM 1799) TaxID=573729 RepID=G2Q3Y0_THET4|nr:uncharacterized protein MYCTH_2124220 [Thermothelomyces thermophilus ATCC 42464]AEO55283.1 hypothetical protein MYCTH_2124220 [Thermothelomyces thermophilus ATCC 42464]